MLTPRFTVSQDDEYIYITIQLSNVRVTAHNVEMVCDGDLFIFSLNPYYLRLRFPGKLIEDERFTSEFVPKEECIKIRVAKETKGEEFKDLDLTAKLLARLNEPTAQVQPKDEKSKKLLIEEVDSQGSGVETVKDIEKEAEDFNWEVEQTITDETGDKLKTEASPKYGFNNQYSRMLNHTVGNGNDINQLTDPDELSADDRILQRMIKENIKFDPEYYANEYLTAKYAPEDCRIKEILAWKNPYDSSEDIKFTEKEEDLMKDLPKRSYLIDDLRPLYYTMVSLLFAYLYDLRSNEGDSTVESGWTIGTLAPQISCVDAQLIQSNNKTETSMLRVVVMTMDRRALAWPLVRNWDLVRAVWADVCTVLKRGRRGVLKALIECREFFRFHDVYYVYCQIWLDDLCNWVLRDCNEKVLRNLAHSLRKVSAEIRKKDIVFEKVLTKEMEFLNLDDIEELAEESYKLALNREQQQQ